MNIELKCNGCGAEFPEADALDDECCPECGCDSLLEREVIDWPTSISAYPVQLSAPEFERVRQNLAEIEADGGFL